FRKNGVWKEWYQERESWCWESGVVENWCLERGWYQKRMVSRKGGVGKDLSLEKRLLLATTKTSKMITPVTAKEAPRMTTYQKSCNTKSNDISKATVTLKAITTLKQRFNR
ncbi:22536_t:CDS:2, partial [Dentiscutata erythropus]